MRLINGRILRIVEILYFEYIFVYFEFWMSRQTGEVLYCTSYEVLSLHSTSSIIIIDTRSTRIQYSRSEQEAMRQTLYNITINYKQAYLSVFCMPVMYYQVLYSSCFWRASNIRMEVVRANRGQVQRNKEACGCWNWRDKCTGWIAIWSLFTRKLTNWNLRV